MMSSGAANCTYPNSIAAVSFIDVIGICLFIKWKLQYHFNSVVFVVSFADSSINRHDPFQYFSNRQVTENLMGFHVSNTEKVWMLCLKQIKVN